MSIFNLERAEDAGELSRLLGESESAAVRRRSAEALGDVGRADDEVTETLIRSAVDDPDESVRATAVDALDSIGERALERLLGEVGDRPLESHDELPVEVLVDALDHRRPELRMAAANAIGWAGVVEAVPALLGRLADEDRRVRLRAVRAAGRVGDERAIDPLLSLTDDPRPGMRKAVAVAIGEIGVERGLPGIVEFSHDEALGVRVAAVRAFGEFSSPRPIEPLVDCFDDVEDEVRRTVAFAMVELLTNAPPERSHEMRTDVVDALSRTHGEVVTSALTELFEESTEAHQRRNAAWLLGRVTDGGTVAIETLVDALDDDDEMVRRFAATSLAEIDSPDVEEALLDALDTTFGDGRSMILFTLGKVGTDVSRERLVRLLDEVDSVETQERALAALSRLGGR